MAVSAYASLVSLTHVLHNLHYRAQFQLPRADLKQVELLQGNAHFLVEFVECHSESKSPAIQGMWKQMAEVAFEAEDTINFHVVNQLHTRSQGEKSDAGFLAFCEDMETLIQKFSYIKERLPEIKDEGEEPKPLKRPNAFFPIADSLAASSSVQKVVIGIDEHVDTIMDNLTSGERKLQVFPITGMGGIGKTTLARTVFYHPHIVEYFDLRIWLTISQGYTIDQILLGSLEEGNIGTCESVVNSGDKLYKRLFERRYLIVMDDVWKIEDLDDLMIFFPDNENGSRIMLTTRLYDVAIHLGSPNPYKLNFLDKDQSWELFCANAFAQIGCPYPNLEKIGKNIVKHCRGLPLEIVVIGHLLANSSMDQEYWKFVAKNINSLGNLEDHEHCLKVLSLSYESLPIHLKPCFLFIRTFHEDSHIKISDLMDKWIAEGFIKQLGDKSLEETASVYAKELINRNLIFRKTEKECGIHDLLRDLCFRESNNEHFILCPKLQYRSNLSWSGNCFLCNGIAMDNTKMHFPHSVHIWASSSPSPEVSAVVCDTCKMLYSHITRPIIVKTTMQGIVQPTELRYCSIIGINKLQLAPTLHLLWNIQFLLILNDSYNSDEVVLPHEIWKMPQLRHVRIRDCGLNLGGFHLPHPIATHIEGADFLVLKSLQTLLKVQNLKFTKDVLDRIPNMKKLEICYNTKLSNYYVCDLAPLENLESLQVYAGPLKNIIFPNSLKKLKLHHYPMLQEDMSILGSLQRLESLELLCCIKESEWNLVEGEFPRLKRLFIKSSELKHWRADSIHFPVLERLELVCMVSLEEIPLGIGDIPTLQSIKLISCSDSAVNSAKRIWEEQQSFGNDNLRIHVVVETGRYQIDSMHSTLTVAASTSWVSLKRLLKELEEVPQRYRVNKEQRESIEEYIQFLREFVEVGYQTKIQEMESLSAVIYNVARRIFPFDPSDWDYENQMARMAFIKDTLSVGEGEGQEDVQARNHNHISQASN